MTFDEVVKFLEQTAKETFDAGVYEYDMGREISATEEDAKPFEIAAESLKEFRNSLFGEDGP